MYGLALGLLLQVSAQTETTMDETETTETTEAVTPPIRTEDDEIEEFPLIMGDVDLCEGVAQAVFLPYIGNCSKYYRCDDGKPVLQSCTDYFQFDAQEQYCLDPSEARCFKSCDSPNLSSFCYDRTCTKYVLCYNRQPVLRQCHDGLQYNVETDRCDYPQYVDCVDNMCTVYNNPHNIIYIPSKANCDKYYICMDGQPINQTCASGLQFNKDCDCCDYPSSVNCSVTALKRNIKPYSRSPPRRADITCPEKGAHFIAHKTRADAYYYCLDGEGLTLDCTPGLLYDAQLEECREPQYIKK